MRSDKSFDHAMSSNWATSGDIEAMIARARIEFDRGNNLRAYEWIAQAESSLDPSNSDDRLSLYGAYTMYLGFPDGHSNEARAKEHLEFVAAAGNVAAQKVVASHYLYGLNGFPKDVTKFELWLVRAVEGDALDALYVYCKYLLQLKRPIPEDFKRRVLLAESYDKDMQSLARRIKRLK